MSLLPGAHCNKKNCSLICLNKKYVIEFDSLLFFNGLLSFSQMGCGVQSSDCNFSLSKKSITCSPHVSDSGPEYYRNCKLLLYLLI